MNRALNEPKTLGEKLLKYRRDRSITQKQLARRVGIDPSTLSRLERNKRKCFPSVLSRVEAFLDAEQDSVGRNQHGVGSIIEQDAILPDRPISDA